MFVPDSPRHPVARDGTEDDQEWCGSGRDHFRGQIQQEIYDDVLVSPRHPVVETAMKMVKNGVATVPQQTGQGNSIAP